MKMMPMATNPVSQNNMELGVRKVCCGIHIEF